MNKFFKIILTIALVMTVVEFARAEGTPQAAKNGPCKADVEKFCAGIEKGQGRILKCLREHNAELSAECKAEGEQRKQLREARKTACQADKDKFCKDLKKGEAHKCMREHEAELSQSCKDAQQKIKDARKN